MNWKDEFVKKINELSDKDFRDGKSRIDIAFSDRAENHERLIAMILEIRETVNSRPVGWVGPGYLKMLGASTNLTPACILESVLSFEVSRDRKYNEIRVEDVATGHVRTGEVPMFASVDFMSL